KRLVARAVAPVDRRSGDVNEAAQAGTLPHRLEEALGGLDVTALVEVQVGPASRQPRHGRQVEDGLDAVEGVPQQVEAQVEFVKDEGRVTPELREVGLLGGAGVVGDEGVQADDDVAVAQQALTEVRADESGSAGDKTFHEGALNYPR